MYIDTHCHLYREYYEDLDKLINNIKPNIIIVSGIDYKSNQEVIDLCNRYKNVYGTLGHHPSCVETYNETSKNYIIKNINNPKIVGVGEIGLDYYWIIDNKDKQIELFVDLLNIAIQYNKTVVIHSRESLIDTYNIIKREEYKTLKKVLHCYSYDLENAHKFIELGVLLGIGGIVTFKNSNLKNIIHQIDLKNLLLETDSPYLTPSPYRGQQNNPTNIPLIAMEISKIKNISVGEVYETTTSTALSQFDIKK